MWCGMVRLKHHNAAQQRALTCVISGPNSVFYQPADLTNPFLPAETRCTKKPSICVFELVSDPPEQPHQNQPVPETEPVIAW